MTKIDTAALRALAEAAKGWMTDATAWPHPTSDGVAVFGNINEEGEKFDLGEVDTGLYFQEPDALPLAQYIAAADPAVMRALLDEFDRLTAENAAQAQQIAQDRADAARLDFMCNKPARFIDVEDGSWWRVYEDTAPPEAPVAAWRAIVTKHEQTPRAAIDAAMAARAAASGAAQGDDHADT